MKFDINNYKGAYAMHCKTEKEAKEFCDYLHSIGKTWHDGDSYQSNTLWYVSKKHTCYEFNNGYRGSVLTYINRNYTILEWSDFTTEFTKADLKDGMIVEYTNGNRGIVLSGRIVESGGHLRIADFTDDLKVTNLPEYTISKVYKSMTPTIADLFNATWFTLIWERKEEPEEMTLEEVCKALGKEIKIVKG